MDLALFEHGEELICCDKEVAKILCGVEVLRGGLLHAARHERVAMVGRRTAVGRGDEQLLPCAARESRLFCQFTLGSLQFGSCVAGLCAGAGVGLVVLFRTNHRVKENLAIVGTLYACSVVTGMLVNLIF